MPEITTAEAKEKLQRIAAKLTEYGEAVGEAAKQRAEDKGEIKEGTPPAFISQSGSVKVTVDPVKVGDRDVREEVVVMTNASKAVQDALEYVLAEQQVARRKGIPEGSRGEASYDYTKAVGDMLPQTTKDVTSYHAALSDVAPKLDAVEARVTQLAERAKSEPQATLNEVDEPNRKAEAARTALKLEDGKERVVKMVQNLIAGDDPRAKAEFVASVASKLGISERVMNDAMRSQNNDIRRAS